MAFLLYGAALAVVHVFRAADIHETVPPLLVMCLTWETALLDLGDGAYAEAPPGLRVLFLLGAPLSVTAIALYELRRLCRHYGLTIRAALDR
ncbi:MAG TPA: hypothetical protein VE546_16910 [Streptomyces sp.]|uniref:hypothetical protein n=1 Tax=Streptomyces sp. TaxID=1931 RepID=UPI002D3BD599|nr:hypothetical protein [Streptomyces sp.]HZG05222.1 hypothetical protein [Streptomyces sp.]